MNRNAVWWREANERGGKWLEIIENFIPLKSITIKHYVCHIVYGFTVFHSIVAVLGTYSVHYCVCVCWCTQTCVHAMNGWSHLYKPCECVYLCVRECIWCLGKCVNVFVYVLLWHGCCVHVELMESLSHSFTLHSHTNTNTHTHMRQERKSGRVAENTKQSTWND